MKLLRTSVLVAVFLGGCERGELSGPPTLRLGRDECAECGMAIHEERSAAATLVDRHGRRDYLLFDDIGCLLDIERSAGSDFKVVDRFVHDHSGENWIHAETAAFLRADSSKLQTPMGSGLAAYADRPTAESGQRQFGGAVMDFETLAAWRRARSEERRKGAGG